MTKNSYDIPVVVEKNKDGFFAYAPTLQGCYTEGETYEKVLENLKEAVRAHLLDRLAEGETTNSEQDYVSLTSLKVAV